MYKGIYFFLLLELQELDLDMSILCSGVFFILEADCDGCLMMVFKCSKHNKGSVPIENVKKCINYWFERIERYYNTSLKFFFCKNISSFQNFKYSNFILTYGCQSI